jgi:hypothetical protein
VDLARELRSHSTVAHFRMTQGPQPLMRRDDERFCLESPLGVPRWRRSVQHVVQDGEQLIGRLELSLITGKVKRDQHPVCQSTVAVRPGIVVGDGIAHIDRHIPRVPAYPILARSHHARTVAPGRNVSRALVIASFESLSGHIPRSSLRSSDLLPFYHQYPAACCGDFLFGVLSLIIRLCRHLMQRRAEAKCCLRYTEPRQQRVRRREARVAHDRAFQVVS